MKRKLALLLAGLFVLAGLTACRAAPYSPEGQGAPESAVSAGGGDMAERLGEAGNPQEYDSYTASRLEAATAVINGCLEKEPQ